jgi:hypothetical protein
MRIFFAIFAVLLATTAGAQNVAEDFDQLRALVKAGDTVTITTASGGIREGRVLDLSPSALGLSIDGQRLEYSMNEVLTVTRNTHASLGKGAAIGAAAGLGTGFLMIGSGSDCHECLFALIAVTTGAGAAGGVGLANSMVSRRLIFARFGGSARWSIAPMIGRDRKGIRASLSW